MINFILVDEKMPKTIYWETVQNVLKKYEIKEQFYLPSEDITRETNWPSLNRQNPYVRGRLDNDTDKKIIDYLDLIIKYAIQNSDKQIICINNNPFFKISSYVKNIKNIIIADINLSEFDRCIKTKSISMPAFPINNRKLVSEKKNYLISFRGKNSHPIREYIKKFNNKNIKIELISDNVNINATTGNYDKVYSKLLSESVMGLVPRGDSLFSYRLLEVMLSGCIPVIISDGWVLPFDRTVNWSECSYKIHYDQIDECIEYLLKVDKNEIDEKLFHSKKIYENYFSSPEKIIKTLFTEILKL